MEFPDDTLSLLYYTLLPESYYGPCLVHDVKRIDYNIHTNSGGCGLLDSELPEGLFQGRVS